MTLKPGFFVLCSSNKPTVYNRCGMQYYPSVLLWLLAPMNPTRILSVGLAFLYLALASKQTGSTWPASITYAVFKKSLRDEFIFFPFSEITLQFSIFLNQDQILSASLWIQSIISMSSSCLQEIPATIRQNKCII